MIISSSLQYYLSQAVAWFYELCFILQMQRSQSIQSDWWAGLVAMKVVWRLSLLDSGALSVMMLGGATMEMYENLVNAHDFDMIQMAELYSSKTYHVL